MKVSLSGEGVSFINGQPVERIGQLEGFSGIVGMSHLAGFNTTIKNPCEKKLTWVIQAQSGTEITLQAKGEKCGVVTAKVTL